MAIKFHEAYERLAPEFDYQTREDTKEFDPESSNGRLMLAVMQEIFPIGDTKKTQDVVNEVLEMVEEFAGIAFGGTPELYLIWNTERKSWATAGYMGYTRVRDEAGIFDKHDAIRLVNEKNKEGEPETPVETMVPFKIEYGDGDDSNGDGSDDDIVPPGPQGGNEIKDKTKEPVKSPAEFLPRKQVLQVGTNSNKISICQRKR